MGELNMSGEISQVAYVLALIGGILLVIFGLLSLVGIAAPIAGPYARWDYGFAYGGIVSLVCGIIAIIGAKSVTTLVWAIVLIIVGLIGGGIGGLLVVLGGIIGLIVYITSKTK
jgi:hypothetical protein